MVAASHRVSAARRTKPWNLRGSRQAADSAHEAALVVWYHGVVLRQQVQPDLPSRRQLRQFSFELARSQQAADRVDLVEHSAQLSL